MQTTIENRKSISECGGSLNELVTEANETKKPVILTHDDQPQAVVIDWETYQKQRNTVRLAFLLGEAEADIEAGRTMSVDECFRDLERDFNVSD